MQALTNMPETATAPQLTAAQRMDADGIESIADRIEQGETQREIAASYGFDTALLNRWLNATPQRSARARSAMAASAEAMADRGHLAIEDAESSMAEIARARVLEQHWRWRAAIRNPLYRERTDHTITGQVQHTVQALTRSQLEQIAAQGLPMVEQVEQVEQLQLADNAHAHVAQTGPGSEHTLTQGEVSTD